MHWQQQTATYSRGTAALENCCGPPSGGGSKADGSKSKGALGHRPPAEAQQSCRVSPQCCLGGRPPELVIVAACVHSAELRQPVAYALERTALQQDLATIGHLRHSCVVQGRSPTASNAGASGVITALLPRHNPN